MDAPLSPTSSASSEPQPRTASSPLRALRTDTKLSPKSQTQRTRVLGALSRIASVAIRDVVKEDGHRFFVIDVHFVKKGLSRPSSTASGGQQDPNASFATTATPSGPPDLQIKRRFSEFANLRHELYYHAHAGHRHHKQPCSFCATVVDFMSHAPALPRLRQAVFQSTASLRRELEEFLGLVVQLASQAKNETASAYWCEGRAMVPLLVKQFVLGDEGESDASVRSSSGATQRPGGWAYTTAWSA